MSNFVAEVAIVGAGLGGLAAAIAILDAGHSVTIVEQASALAEIGAGVQIPPNSSRILNRLGVLKDLESLSEKPTEFLFRSYRDGGVLARANLASCEERDGVPYLHVHRADFHEVLVKEVRRRGGKVLLNSHVEDIDLSRPALHIKQQPDVVPDIIIGADGVWSICREKMLGRPAPPRLSGDVAYRCVIETEKARGDPQLLELVQSHSLHYWIGPGQHVVGYRLRDGHAFNIVIAGTGSQELSSTGAASQEELCKRVAAWDPRLRSLLRLADRGVKGPLMLIDELDTWTHEAGKFTLLGDAAHATLPYLAQGAAQALEDGAVLGHLFQRICHGSQLHDALIIYEALRKNRTGLIVRSAMSSRKLLHLNDGSLQAERDRQLLEKEPFEGFPHPWADPSLRAFIFDYDAEVQVKHAWLRYLSGCFPGTSGAWRYSSDAQRME